MSQEVFLKPNVLAEPLVCNWYAWTHLIQPLTAGRNIVDRHLTIMRSFVQTPQVHAGRDTQPRHARRPVHQLRPGTGARTSRR